MTMITCNIENSYILQFLKKVEGLKHKIGLLALALMFALPSCVGAERLGPNPTVVINCVITTTTPHEGPIGNGKLYYPLLINNNEVVIINPFYVTGQNTEYYVGYIYGGWDGPRLQIYTPKNNATISGDCQPVTVIVGPYKSGQGYKVTTPTGEEIHAGVVTTRPKK